MNVWIRINICITSIIFRYLWCRWSPKRSADSIAKHIAAYIEISTSVFFRVFIKFIPIWTIIIAEWIVRCIKSGIREHFNINFCASPWLIVAADHKDTVITRSNTGTAEAIAAYKGIWEIECPNSGSVISICTVTIIKQIAADISLAHCEIRACITCQLTRAEF